jgi:hypothetical protein
MSVTERLDKNQLRREQGCNGDTNTFVNGVAEFFRSVCAFRVPNKTSLERRYSQRNVLGHTEGLMQS